MTTIFSCFCNMLFIYMLAGFVLLSKGYSGIMLCLQDNLLDYRVC